MLNHFKQKYFLFLSLLIYVFSENDQIPFFLQQNFFLIYYT